MPPVHGPRSRLLRTTALGVVGCALLAGLGVLIFAPTAAHLGPPGPGAEGARSNTGAAPSVPAIAGAEPPPAIPTSGTAAAVNSSLALFTTALLGGTPSAEAYDSGTHELYVTHNNGRTVTVLSDPGLALVATIAVGTGPDGIAYDSAKGELFVANAADGNVSVIADSNHTVVATIMVGSNPWGVAYDPTLGEIFVSAYLSNAVVVIADANNTVVTSVSLGSNSPPAAGPTGLVYDAGTEELYVGAWVTGVVVVYYVNQTVPMYVGTIMVGSHPDALAYDPQTSEIYVTCHNAPGTVEAISDASHRVVAVVAVGDNPIGIAYDSAQNELVVANAGSANASVISASTGRLLQTVNLLVMGTPYGVEYDARTGALFVTDPSAGAAVVLLPSYEVLYAVTGLPTGSSWNVFFSGNATSGYSIVNDQHASVALVGDFLFPAGSYSYRVFGPPGFLIVPDQGSFSVPNVTTLVFNFAEEYTVTFVESGLPAPINWTVDLNGTVQGASGATVQYVEINGSYGFTVSGPSGFAPNVTAGTVVVAGANVTRAIGFAAVYTVTFTEHGLPAGTNWSVSLASVLRASTSPTIRFAEPVGSYPFAVGAVHLYAASPASGTVYVTGTDTGQTINFTATPAPSSYSTSPSGLFGLPDSEGLGLLLGGVGVVVVVGALVLLRRRPGRPARVDTDGGATSPVAPPAETGTPPPETGSR